MQVFHPVDCTYNLICIDHATDPVLRVAERVPVGLPAKMS